MIVSNNIKKVNISIAKKHRIKSTIIVKIKKQYPVLWGILLFSDMSNTNVHRKVLKMINHNEIPSTPKTKQLNLPNQVPR